jgi:hypothetical protein
MADTPNPKCSKCKCYWKPEDTDIKPSGLHCKTCKKCRERYKYNCHHNRQKAQCKECGGSSICPHDKRKSNCRDCGGSSICEHDKQRQKCRDCGGSQICIHNKQKSHCRDCGGGSICIHNKFKSQCRDCGGGSICIHNKFKSICRDCGGSQICEHNREKSKCKECNLQLYLINLQRGQIKRCLKLSNLSKTKHSIEYLGCSTEYFIEYFKKKMELFNQFSEIEMTWDNIHIDHIKPVSVFNLDDEEEFLSCCHYTNLQPLLAEVNLSKNCKWTDEDDVFWNENIKDKEYYDIYLPS